MDRFVEYLQVFAALLIFAAPIGALISVIIQGYYTFRRPRKKKRDTEAVLAEFEKERFGD